jgi:short-subunit dehydrogenase
MTYSLITGASAGIGYELAKLMASQQHNLILVARSQSRLEKLAEELRSSYGIQVETYAIDLSRSGSAQEVFDWAQGRGLLVDHLVNNAGFGLLGPFVDLSLKEQLEMIQLNVNSLVELTGLFLPQMRKRKSGRILNVASTAAFQPGPLMAVYYATKSFVLSFSEALSEELRGQGVSVSVLCPGPTPSEFQVRAKINMQVVFKEMPMTSAAEVAACGYQAMMTAKVIEVPGWFNHLVIQLNRLTPRMITRKMVFWMQSRR